MPDTCAVCHLFAHATVRDTPDHQRQMHSSQPERTRIAVLESKIAVLESRVAALEAQPQVVAWTDSELTALRDGVIARAASEGVG